MTTTIDSLDVLSRHIDSLPAFELASNPFIRYYSGVLDACGEDPRVEGIVERFNSKTKVPVEMVTQHQDILYEATLAVAKDEPLAEEVGSIMDKFIQPEHPLYALLQVAASGNPVDYDLARVPILAYRKDRANQQFDLEFGLVFGPQDDDAEKARKRELRANSIEQRSDYVEQRMAEIQSKDSRRLVYETLKDSLITLTSAYSIVLEETQKTFDRAIATLDGAYEKSQFIILPLREVIPDDGKIMIRV
ncbi:MAG: hypothetical protein WCV90_08415 [Candidatus Woesearchaeota archaeon]|jgi:hypothetical protein